MDLTTEITALLTKELSLEAGAVKGDAHLQDDLGADSLVLMNLAETLKSKYAIELEADDLLDVETVDDLMELIHSKSGTGS